MANSRKAAMGRLYAVVAAMVAALVVAGCGSSSSSSTPTSNAAASNSSTSSTTAAAGLSISTTKSKDGTYLIGASGRALYLWVADSNGKSSCAGACAQAWPPLTTTGTPAASHGAMAADLGTITRSDGTKQVTYKGHPLYYFAGDPAAGTTHGQGSPQFGAKWWLVAPSGAAITGSASSGGSGSGSSTSSSGGGWG
jgi:predicted lipoprotein with Yx(FWY)xxD motif